jgi:hypothetical protein
MFSKDHFGLYKLCIRAEKVEDFTVFFFFFSFFFFFITKHEKIKSVNLGTIYLNHFSIQKLINSWPEQSTNK